MDVVQRLQVGLILLASRYRELSQIVLKNCQRILHPRSTSYLARRKCLVISWKGSLRATILFVVFDYIIHSLHVCSRKVR